MGALAERHGYYDNAESLMVIDPSEAFIFHILPDHSGASATWVAQRVPDAHVGVVANSFTVRTVDMNDSHTFLHSSNLEAAARATGRWRRGEAIDFTRVFAGPEPGHKYASGRRMWQALRHLAPHAASSLPAEYSEYVSASPYPATLAASNVTTALLRAVMRDYYQGTPYDLSTGMAAGPWQSPSRWTAAAGVRGNFERPIAIQRTIVSYVVACRGWLPSAVGGVLWFSMHASHTSVYVPFLVGATRAGIALPDGFTKNSGKADRGVGAWQASRFVFAACQLDFQKSILAVQRAQAKWEGAGQELVDNGVASFLAGRATIKDLVRQCNDHATAAVGAWWRLSDELIMAVDYPSNTYPEWWLTDPAVNFTHGPPPSPAVPPV